MSIKDSPNRVVRTISSTVAFIGHNQQANEDVLIECFVDAATNTVSFKSGSKARKGVDYVEADESVQPLIDATNALIEQQRQAGITPVTDRPIIPETPVPLTGDTQPPWRRLGFSSKADWKAAGSPAE